MTPLLLYGANGYTGKLIAQMMAGEAPLIPLEPYRHTRFF